MHFTNFFNINNSNGHRDLNFIDIDLDKDTKLFIDPSLINGLLDDFCENSNNTITSFFNCIFDNFKNNNTEALKLLLNYGHEPNETKLGMSSGKPKGKGTTSDGLYDIFKDIAHRNLMDYELIEDPMDLCVFVHKFAEDKMSDLITNVIRNQLYQFTVAQCNNYGISLSENKTNLGKYWDIDASDWKTLYDYALLVNEKPILLVPKNIVRDKYIYSVNQYFNIKILEFRQQYHLSNQTSLCRLKTTKNRGSFYVKPSKKKLRKVEVGEMASKDFVTEITKKNPQLIKDFRSETKRRIALGDFSISNDKLDEIVYNLK